MDLAKHFESFAGASRVVSFGFERDAPIRRGKSWSDNLSG
jgi:hypothetical protein